MQAAAIAIPLLMSAASAGAGIISANQQKSQYENQAALARQQAQNARTEATLKGDEITRRANKVAGAQAAAAGAGGVDISGSIVDNLADTKAAAARDIFNVKWSADARADNLEASAANLQSQGSQVVSNAWLGAGLKMGQALGGAVSSGLSGIGGGYVPVSQSTASQKWFESLDRSPWLTNGGVV